MKYHEKKEAVENREKFEFGIVDGYQDLLLVHDDDALWFVFVACERVGSCL